MHFLYDILISPIESFIEFCFCFSLSKFDMFGVTGAIIAVSLAVNFLALPLYNMADALQLRERNLQQKMSRWTAHIKKTFKGDEQFMMLNTYYRINNYHPLYALRSALSIMIEIPFFIAGYHFLSNCTALDGQSILFLKDLGSPDSLIRIGRFNLNLLPVLMTAINAVSTAVYTKGAPLREKIQTYVLAVIFLFLLYNSPSGLVFYWILNNTFSLVKNIVLNFKNPGKFVYSLFSLCFSILCISIPFVFKYADLKKKLFIVLFSMAFIAAPYIYNYVRIKFNLSVKNKIEDDKSVFPIFFFSCISLWLLAGFTLPSATIATSPEEFSFLGSTNSPLTYINSSVFYFFGLFVAWPLCIFKMFNSRVKSTMSLVFFVMAICAITNVYVFKHEYGMITVFFGLQDKGCLKINSLSNTLGSAITFLITVLLYIICSKHKKQYALFSIAIILSISEFIFGLSKYVIINREYQKYVVLLKDNSDSNNTIQPEINLSKTERNVVVFFIDLAMTQLFPHITEQFPELNRDFSGFTYYPNTLSFSGSTLIASPALHGGYDYMPSEIDSRSDELLVEKHNESLLVMPTLFNNAGYDVTLIDPCDANYKDKYGFEIYDGLPEINTKSLMGKYSKNYADEHPDADLLSKNEDKITIKAVKRFSILQMVFPSMRDSFYNGGKYYQIYPKNLSSSNAFNTLDSFSELYYLPQITETNNNKPTYTYIYNLLLHEESPLRNDFSLGKIDEQHPEATTGNFKPSNATQRNYYQVYAAGIKMLASWINFLKENEVYDNTRIIIVSDHGNTGAGFSNFTPLLMVKDFNETGELKTSSEFMTNAETVNLAIKKLNIPAINPMNGNALKTKDDFNTFEIGLAKTGTRSALRMRNEKKFLYGKKYVFTGKDVYNNDNWKQIE